LIVGGPTLVGTLIGQRFVSESLSIAFLALAAGSVLYVVIELLAVARRTGMKELTTWCILAGLSLGFLTDGILIAAGALGFVPLSGALRQFRRGLGKNGTESCGRFAHEVETAAAPRPVTGEA
jgi:zinc transporter ZupT